MTREEIQAEALKEALRHHRSGISMGTGTGKTRVGLAYVKHLWNENLRVQLLAPTSGIFKEWENEAVKVGCEYLLEHINFSTYLSIDKCSFDADILILEEFHHMVEESHDPWLRQFKGRILGLSGTPPRYTHSEKGKMMLRYCPLVFEYGVDDAVGHGILNDYRIIIHPLVLSTVVDLWKPKKSGGGWMTSEKKDYDSLSRWVNGARGKEKQIASVMRMKALMGYRTKEDYGKRLYDSITEACILFGNTQEQVDRMSRHTYHSNNPASEENLELFRSGQISKLGAVLQLNEGINLPVRQEIIMHSYGNERKLAQRIGRGLRLNPDECVTIHVLQYSGTIDQTWVDNSLQDFDSNKITIHKT